MSVSSVEAGLPPGFRFHPKDEELVADYLLRWVRGCPHPHPSFLHLHLNSFHPSDLPESACVGGKEWYFYNQRDRKYATGLRTNRATVSGYWKATGKDRPVFENGTLVGMRKTLVFYQGRAPKGRKTDWVMHEFRLHGPDPKQSSSSPPVKEDWVLCRVFLKNRRDPILVGEEGSSGAGYEVRTWPLPPSSPSLPGPAMTVEACASSDHPQHQQVPCFSMFNDIGSQTNPNFSHVSTGTPLDPHPPHEMPLPSGMHLPAPDRPQPDHHLGIHNNNYNDHDCYYPMNAIGGASSSSSNGQASLDMMKGYYENVGALEMAGAAGDGEMAAVAPGSSPLISFRKAVGSSGSCANYLSSEVGPLLSSLWNHYN